jgi:hypothetical protein
VRTVEEILNSIASNGRVCPQPPQWNALWEMLPERKSVGGGWEPALPFILAAWWDSSDSTKRERFVQHLKYANDHGALNNVANYLASLTDEQWHVQT